MLLWQLLLVVCACGALGGVINALLSDDRGFALPQTVSGVFRPGFIGNIFIGAVTAGLFWVLYGPFAESIAVGTAPSDVASTGRVEGGNYGETLSGLGGAVLAGVAGARLLTQLVDKQFFQKAASEAAGKPGSEVKAQQIATASPVEALNIAESM